MNENNSAKNSVSKSLQFAVFAAKGGLTSF